MRQEEREFLLLAPRVHHDQERKTAREGCRLAREPRTQAGAAVHDVLDVREEGDVARGADGIARSPLGQDLAVRSPGQRYHEREAERSVARRRGGEDEEHTDHR